MLSAPSSQFRAKTHEKLIKITHMESKPYGLFFVCQTLSPKRLYEAPQSPFSNLVYDAIPISLAIDRSGLYIGIGNRQIPFEKNGMVLWVEYS